MILVLILFCSSIFLYQQYQVQKEISSYYLGKSIHDINDNAYLLTSKIKTDKLKYSNEEIKEIISYQDRIITEYTNLFNVLFNVIEEDDPTILNPVEFYFYKSLNDNISIQGSSNAIVELDKEDEEILNILEDFAANILKAYQDGDYIYTEKTNLKKTRNFLQQISLYNKALITSLE